MSDSDSDTLSMSRKPQFVVYPRDVILKKPGGFTVGPLATGTVGQDIGDDGNPIVVGTRAVAAGRLDDVDWMASELWYRQAETGTAATSAKSEIGTAAMSAKTETGTAATSTKSETGSAASSSSSKAETGREFKRARLLCPGWAILE